MKPISWRKLGPMGAMLLTACAGDSTATSPASAGPAVISVPANPDNPPVTMNGYVETSVTTRIK